MALRVTLALVVLTGVAIAAWPGLIRGLILSEGFMPHGHCYFWTPGLVWLHFSTDILIALSYFAISVTLAILVQKSRGDVPFPLVFVAFGIFIVACGATHAVEVITIWQPLYWFSGAVKMVTAVASFTTALLLPPLVPKVLGLVREARLSRERQERLVAARTQRDEAVAASRAKDQFLATLSHELRTPMASVIGWATFLSKEIGDDPQHREALGAIVDASRVQQRLIEDLLDVSRIVTGKMEIRDEQVDLKEIVSQAVASISHEAGRRGVAVEKRFPTGDVKLLGDSHRLQQVVRNLLSNAVKFSHEGGTVLILVAEKSGHAVIRVRDEGVGIDPEFLPMLFDRFAQQDGTSTRQHGGLGLGLSIVRHIVGLHAGRVYARSEGIGKGAEFVVEIPLTRPRGESAEPTGE